jgi:hypothetical protein
MVSPIWKYDRSNIPIGINVWEAPREKNDAEGKANITHNAYLYAEIQPVNILNWV